jgi:hypothetical protein
MDAHAAGDQYLSADAVRTCDQVAIVKWIHAAEQAIHHFFAGQERFRDLPADIFFHEVQDVDIHAGIFVKHLLLIGLRQIAVKNVLDLCIRRHAVIPVKEDLLEIMVRVGAFTAAARYPVLGIEKSETER